MKKILIIAIIVFAAGMLFSKNVILAASPSPSPSDQAIQQQLDELKTRIASRVAELKLVEKRGIIGKVSDVNDSQITVTDLYGNTRFIDVDELTKFSNPSVTGTSFGISDITNGMQLGILGLYNKQSRRILARDVQVLVLPKMVTGAVSSIDNKNYNFYITSEDGKQTFIDVEVVTKTYAHSAGVLATAGFSKITTGEMTVIQGFPDKQNPSHIIASTIILLPDVPKSPKINIVPALNPNASTIPSTGSGVKLTPIVK
jgi:hypothetical protein